jgi:hypothetical protein
MNIFKSAIELRQLKNKITILIEAEQRGIALDESEMERSMQGIANVGQKDMDDYYSHCALRKTMRTIFLASLTELTKTGDRE